MIRKIMCIGMIGIFLLTGISSVSAVDNTKFIVTGDGFNYSIDSVTYEPETIEKEKLVVFTVTVGFENTEDAVYIELYIDEYCNPDDGMASAATPERPTVELEYTWPNDYEDHNVLIMIDPENQDAETDETDNTWEETLSAYETPDEEKPDFVITKIELGDYFDGHGYPVILTINNRGGAVEKMDVTIRLIIENSRYHNSEEYYIEYEDSGKLTDPQPIIINIPKRATLTAEIDPPYENHPNGAIDEWNDDGDAEDNNILTKHVILSKNTNSIIDFVENMLDNRFDWPFPMLRVMLWALGK